MRLHSAALSISQENHCFLSPLQAEFLFPSQNTETQFLPKINTARCFKKDKNNYSNCPDFEHVSGFSNIRCVQHVSGPLCLNITAGGGSDMTSVISFGRGEGTKLSHFALVSPQHGRRASREHARPPRAVNVSSRWSAPPALGAHSSRTCTRDERRREPTHWLRALLAAALRRGKIHQR